MRAHFKITHDAPGIMAIEDMAGDHMSITNDAEAVVKYLHKYFNLDDRRLIYRDTAGDWDELNHSGVTFLGFFCLNVRSLAEALAKIKPSEYSVSIREGKDSDSIVAELYSGPSYQEAFDLAVAARNKAEYRLKWIRFATPEATKWAEVR
jgi:hypothetical protein